MASIILRKIELCIFGNHPCLCTYKSFFVGYVNKSGLTAAAGYWLLASTPVIYCQEFLQLFGQVKELGFHLSEFGVTQGLGFL